MSMILTNFLIIIIILLLLLLQTTPHDTKSSTQSFSNSCHVATVRATTKVMVEVHTQIPGQCSLNPIVDREVIQERNQKLSLINSSRQPSV